MTTTTTDLCGNQGAHHPDFGGVGHAAVLLEHPLVVGEQQLEAEAERQDEGEPQQGAEDQRRQHGLPLGAERHVEAADGRRKQVHRYRQQRAVTPQAAKRPRQ